jgi:aminobenzoyl-glutamate utilization protein A
LKEQIGRVKELAAALEPELVAARRDFHKYAEPGWTEFRTTAVLAKKLTRLGYQVDIGDKVINKDAMMGVPKLERFP